MIQDIVKNMEMQIDDQQYVNIDSISFELTELLRGLRNKNNDWLSTIFDAFDVKGEGLMEYY